MSTYTHLYTQAQHPKPELDKMAECLSQTPDLIPLWISNHKNHQPLTTTTHSCHLFLIVVSNTCNRTQAESALDYHEDSPM